MVDGGSVVWNIAQTVAFLAATPLLWLFLYLFTWEDSGRAKAAGFGRSTFWLLVVGGILGILGDIPILPIGRFVLGISVAGGLIPLVLSTIFLVRLSADSRQSHLPFAGLIAAETAAALVAVVVLPGLFAPFAVLVCALVASAVAINRFAPPVAPALGAAFALISAAIVVTFLATSSEVGYGIVSEFPFYLFAPVGVGVVAVAVIEALHLPSFSAFPLAYSTATIGVLIGADVLRQPPLYGPGVGQFFVIGGAGPTDLLYLSGLVAVVAAWGFDRVLHRPTSRPVPEAPTLAVPEVLLRSAVTVALSGDPATATRLAGEAADVAVARARLLTGAPPSPPDRPWSGLPVPTWVDLDHRNLRALVTSRERRPRDAPRAWWTARWLVRVARDISRKRFARPSLRLTAGSVDAAVLLVPAFALWLAIDLGSTGSATALITSAWFNAAAVGYAAWGLVYFVVAEAAFGTTLGKRWLGLVVTDRALRRPAPIPALLRNLPKLVPLFVIGIVGADLTFLALRGGADLTVGPAGIVPFLTAVVALLVVLVLGVSIPTAAGGLAISWSAESQRIGDVLAGTWVVTAQPLTTPPPGASAPAALRAG
ncbi:MAG: RDD family protein [Thermoplasmata archaeon]|nr:RDD family protein [Thermoplasmata archaeon]